MARPPMFSVQEKQRIVLSVLRGEASVAEAARRNKCSETSIAKWREQFVQGDVRALEARCGAAQLSLGEIAGAAKEGLLALAVGTGLAVLTAPPPLIKRSATRPLAKTPLH